MRYIYLLVLLTAALNINGQLKSSFTQNFGFRNTHISGQKNDFVNFLSNFEPKSAHTYIGWNGIFVVQNKSRIEAQISAYDDRLPRNMEIKMTHFLRPSIGVLIGIDKYDLLYNYPYYVNYLKEMPGFYPSSQVTNSLKGHYLTITNLYAGAVYRYEYRGFETEAELKLGLLNPNNLEPERQIYTSNNSFEVKGVGVSVKETFPVNFDGQITLAYYPFKKVGFGVKAKYRISQSRFAFDYSRSTYHWTEQNFEIQDIKIPKQRFGVSTFDFGLSYRFKK